MDLDFLDEDGRRVLNRAQDLAREGETEDRALILALLEDGRARVALASVFIGAREVSLALTPGVAYEGLVRLAYEQARDRGRMAAGPEDVLLAVVRTSPLATRLEQGGLTVENLTRTAYGEPRPSPAPAAVWMCGLSMLAQGFCCACPLTFTAMGALASAPRDWMLVFVSLNAVWTLCACLLLGGALLGSAPEVWAPATAFQAVRTVTIVALAVYSATRPDPQSFGGVVVALPTALTALALFRHRSSFQIPEREKWRALWRKGGWALSSP